MCIAASVGRLALNHHDDVKTVQVLLNLNIGKLIPLAPLILGGHINPFTITAIEQFQTRVMKMSPATGKVDPGSKTLDALRMGIQTDSCKDVLQGIYIHADQAHITKYASHLDTLMGMNAINTHLRQAHFIAQVGHESGELRYSQELASGNAYEGRKDLGNTHPGDGPKFKGRGLIQLTGRTNYHHYGSDRGMELTTDPSAVATNPRLAVDVSCWFWTKHKLNAPADADSVERITRTINGGTNGLANRKELLARAKFFIS